MEQRDVKKAIEMFEIGMKFDNATSIFNSAKILMKNDSKAALDMIEGINYREFELPPRELIELENMYDCGRLLDQDTDKYFEIIKEGCKRGMPEFELVSIYETYIRARNFEGMNIGKGVELLQKRFNETTNSDADFADYFINKIYFALYCDHKSYKEMFEFKKENVGFMQSITAFDEGNFEAFPTSYGPEGNVEPNKLYASKQYPISILDVGIKNKIKNSSYYSK